MSIEETFVSLDGVHQSLVDINGTIVPFDAEITINPPNDTDTYNISVVSQSDLDAGSISFTPIQGPTKLSKKYESPTFQNFYVCIKSDTVIKDIKVTIQLVQLPQLPQIIHRQVVEPDKSDSDVVRIILALFVIVIGGFFLQKFWKQK